MAAPPIAGRGSDGTQDEGRPRRTRCASPTPTPGTVTAPPTRGPLHRRNSGPGALPQRTHTPRPHRHPRRRRGLQPGATIIGRASTHPTASVHRTALTGQSVRDVRTPGATGPPAREPVRQRRRSVVPVVRALWRPKGTAVRRLGTEGAGEACTIDRAALCRSARLRRPEARWPADGARGLRGTGARRYDACGRREVQATTAQATIRTIKAAPLTVDTRGRSRCAAPRRSSRPRRPASRSNPPRVRRASSSSPSRSRFTCRSRRGGCDRSSSMRTHTGSVPRHPAAGS